MCHLNSGYEYFGKIVGRTRKTWGGKTICQREFTKTKFLELGFKKHFSYKDLL
jgi:hypothetical protein